MFNWQHIYCDMNCCELGCVTHIARYMDNILIQVQNSNMDGQRMHTFIQLSDMTKNMHSYLKMHFISGYERKCPSDVTL